MLISQGSWIEKRTGSQSRFRPCVTIMGLTRLIRLTGGGGGGGFKLVLVKFFWV